VLLVSGSTRGASTNTAALRTLETAATGAVRAVRYDGLADLPAFNPDDDPADGRGTPPAVVRLRAELEAADAVLFCTPEYAGTLPGSLKNLLEWTVGGGQLVGKPVAWINVAAPGRGEGAVANLATVLGYVDARVVDTACRRVHVGRDTVAGDGTVSDPATRDALLDVLLTLADAAG
jgi:NAD(P)H-dependent FMN reductase